MSNNPPMTEPTVQTLPNGWKLIGYGTQQISIAPDGLIMFDRHATPEQIPDYIGALTAAAEIATTIREHAANQTVQAAAGLPTSTAIVTAGPPPPGATPIPQKNRATIGRPKTRQQGPR